MASEHETLTKQKLHSILQETEGTDAITILQYSAKPGTEVGDNYSGELVKLDFRAQVGESKKEYHWMVKLTSVASTLLRGTHAEEKEIMFYRDLLMKWNKIAQEKGAKFRLNNYLAPYTEFNPDGSGKRSILAMENLQYYGYEDAPHKKLGLSLDHVKLALEEVAHFHALGYHYIKSYPGGINEGLEKNRTFITDYIVASAAPGPLNFRNASPGRIRSTLKFIEESGQDLSEIFWKSHEKDDITKRFKEAFSPNADGFNVLCHGDLWFNNLLFRHQEDGTPVRVVLLDVSLCRWASPCTDLAYFLYSSTTPQLRETHMDEMLGHYHDNLVRCLAELGEDPAVYPYRQLLKDYNRYCLAGFWFASLALPMVLAKKEDALSQENMIDPAVDPEAAAKRARERTERAIRNEPQIKVMVAGAFLETMKRGAL